MTNSRKNFVLIALGSNLGDREKNILNAIKYLSDSALEIHKISSIYESPALLKPNSPEEWNNSFYNCAVSGITSLSANYLLEKTQEIERKINNSREKGNWSPREIDIDIISYNDEIIDETELQIPHLEIEKRLFVLYPIKEIEPEWINPRFDSYSIGNYIINLENNSDKKEIPKKIKDIIIND